MLYRLKSAPPSEPAKGAPAQGLVLSGALMRDKARDWHRDNPDFVLEALRSLARCQDSAEEATALHWHAEALSIGFWTKKDVVQYPVACLHCHGSMISVASFRHFLDGFHEGDKDIMQHYIDATPLHHWTYMRNKVMPMGAAP